ncbi:MAG: hypothetical protein NTW05_10260 [Pseudonocardiales bacterium]|jgi:hypothetical protein|nr:hypothetical protein [Pseudonocardiales bacterium]
MLAVLMAVLSDLTAAEAPLHAATLAVVGAVVVGFRARVTPWCIHVFPVLAAIVALQPALHVGMKLVPHGALGHAAGRGVGVDDVMVNGTQIVLALVVVVALGSLQRVFELVSRVLRVLVVLLAPLRPEPADVVRRPDTRPERPPGPPLRAVIVRRGPPRIVATG